MNDISLTGCFINDVQSPEKIGANGGVGTRSAGNNNNNTSIIQILNENSRDSIFFNVIFHFSYLFSSFRIVFRLRTK